jgi:hypothetical protein
MAQDRKLNGISAEAVKAALYAEHGNMLQTAKRLGVYRSHLYVHVHNRPTLMEAWEDAKESELDISEIKLFEARDRGERWAIMYHLSTQGRARGWGSVNGPAPLVLGDQVNVTSVTIRAVESDSFVADGTPAVEIRQITVECDPEDEAAERLFQTDIAAE